jgi:hypothetical protein
MSVTFSGGITFTGGGFSFTAAPPAEATYGWFGAGYSAPTAPLPSGGIYSGVQRIDYANDLTTASVRGPLTLARYELAGTGNTDYGWFGAGYTPAAAPANVVSLVDRITYATDTATASVRGPLVLSTAFLAATGTSTAGWFGGGVPGSSLNSVVSRITYATDTATASQRGPLNSVWNLQGIAATTDKTTYGWFAGGFALSNSRVSRIAYATDTATASVRGPLSAARYYLAGTGNSNYGWFGSGYPLTTAFERITYATDTATASVRGTLTYSSTACMATGNDTYGWFAGGYVPTTLMSQVNRITFATDTATASARGALATYVAWSGSSTNTLYA